MPVYEFYCPDCHTVFNFFSRTINTSKRPHCPRCSRPKLDRKVSRFAISKRSAGGDEGGDLPEPDETKMEQVMEELARDSEGLDENDPRQIARMMRKLHETGGLPLNGKAEEAIRRLEAGESPEKLEEEMGDLFDDIDPDSADAGKSRGPLRRRQPTVDQTLYDL